MILPAILFAAGLYGFIRWWGWWKTPDDYLSLLLAGFVSLYSEKK